MIYQTIKFVDVKFEVEFPPPLKKKLIEDNNFITRHKYLVRLPRKPSVRGIIASYLSDLIEDAKKEEVKEVLDGLIDYFDRGLGIMLLYKFERQQYSEQLKRPSSKPPSEVYGAEHLLRLIAKLPVILGNTNVESESVQILNLVLGEFLQHLSQNVDTMFPSELYERPTSSYIRNSE
eukprot:TRINITY_DN4639_c0_g1_i3.p1 TRINITY_DN4639_c0_g1~~TRINITY_DN4639_c0_g1_i3.p1  ORF type:complete len:177 (-),score=37.24 TRINITY_DN4639_c0_g1_i3:51-581(-)